MWSLGSARVARVEIFAFGPWHSFLFFSLDFRVRQAKQIEHEQPVPHPFDDVPCFCVTFLYEYVPKSSLLGTRLACTKF